MSISDKADNKKRLKCVIWDLDNTLWDGILLESDNVKLKDEIVETIKELDAKGILNSIASKNNYEQVMNKLNELKISEFFVYPQVGWNPKSLYVDTIQKKLNIGMEGIMFVDDDPYEIEEVLATHKEIRCLTADKYKDILELEEVKSLFVTEDSKLRRIKYMQDIERSQLEEMFQGPKEEFLETLNMQLIISEAETEQLRRCEELTIRTNQLNSTGITYSYDELKELKESKKHKILICELKDRLGSYGNIGLALIEIKRTSWHIKLLITSCRVISRGIGSILLSCIMNEAKKENKIVTADFIDTGKNRAMNITYRFSNFKEKFTDYNGITILENDLSYIPIIPNYIEIIAK